MYRELLYKKIQEKIIFFKSANLTKEAKLLQDRLNLLTQNNTQKVSLTLPKKQMENPVLKVAVANLKNKLEAKNCPVSELEKQFILEKIKTINSLKELSILRINYLESFLKAKRAFHCEKVDFNTYDKEASGPYNNEKIFFNALKLIYSQDPLWIEEFKELYSSMENI